MKKIGALIDTDERMKDVLETSFRLAEQQNADLVIYHQLLKDENITIEGSNVFINDEENLIRNVSLFSAAYDVRYTISVDSGRFKKSIVKLVKNEGIDLLVVGSNGRSNTSEVVLGSHAEKVIENAPCSVLVLKDIKMNHALDQILYRVRHYIHPDQCAALSCRGTVP